MWRFYTYVLYRCNTERECVLVNPPALTRDPLPGGGGLAGENVPPGQPWSHGPVPETGNQPGLGLGLGDWDCIGG